MAIEVTITAALVGGGTAAIISSGISVLNLWRERRAQERRQIRELAVQIALENFRTDTEKRKAANIGTQPLDVYLVHAMTLVSCLDGRLRTPEQIRQHIQSGFDSFRAATTAIQEYAKKESIHNKPIP